MKDMNTFLLATAIALVVSFLAGVWVFRSAMEANAYENATGQTVSTWDAMWIELRVQASPRD